MTTIRGLLSILAETSVHAGTGSQLGAVDLPIQRERHTEWPTIYGTGLKGVLRDEAERGGWSKETIRAVFGPDTEKNGQKEASRHSGALAISDARLLLFPVRTMGKAFAWLTCPLALARLRRDVETANTGGAKLSALPLIADTPSGDSVLVCSTHKEEQILLEEFEYQAKVSNQLDAIAGWIANNLLPWSDSYAYWRQMAHDCIVVVSDDDFRDFARHGTEIMTRIKLGKEKTVEEGPWTEENLPSDTLLYSFVVAWPPAKSADPGVEKYVTEKLVRIPAERGNADRQMLETDYIMNKFTQLTNRCPIIQVGGNETVGRGYVAIRLIGGDHAQNS